MHVTRHSPPTCAFIFVRITKIPPLLARHPPRLMGLFVWRSQTGGCSLPLGEGSEPQSASEGGRLGRATGVRASTHLGPKDQGAYERTSEPLTSSGGGGQGRAIVIYERAERAFYLRASTRTSDGTLAPFLPRRGRNGASYERGYRASVPPPEAEERERGYRANARILTRRSIFTFAPRKWALRAHFLGAQVKMERLVRPGRSSFFGPSFLHAPRTPVGPAFGAFGAKRALPFGLFTHITHRKHAICVQVRGL